VIRGAAARAGASEEDIDDRHEHALRCDNGALAVAGGLMPVTNRRSAAWTHLGEA
jgi:hypothetical protein